MESQQINKYLKYISDNSRYLEHNKILFNIHEGELLKYILADLQEQLSPESFTQICFRIAPINILKRIISKLSKIYAKPPLRTIVNGNKNDEELLSYYIEEMNLNNQMTIANELFNLHKAVTLEPYIENNKPRLRAIPADRNIFYSDNKVNPLSPTAWIKCLIVTFLDGQTKKIYHIFTDNEFVPVDEEGNVLNEILIMNENPQGINPYGKIPAVYINRSSFSIIPTIDSDTLKMTKSLPIILSDLNYASMYNCFGIIYGINVKTEGLVKAPNAFWQFTADPTSDKNPELGVLKPDVDIDKVINLVKTELVLWLNSRNIRPGSVGDLNAENISSGIAKIVEESDTVEDRQAQIPYFIDAEKKLFNLIINNLHPYWKATGQIDNNLEFSSGVSVNVVFPEQIPLVKRSEVVDMVIKELNAGLTTRERAIKLINPELTNQEIQTLLREIEKQNTIELPEEGSEDGMQEEEKTKEITEEENERT